MILIRLFWSFFQIGLFSFGGGYGAMPLIQKQVVNINHWLSMGEFIDVVTISQMTPGPIAINASTFVGMRIGGPLGAVVATVGCITPSCIIVLVLAYLYNKYRNMWAVQGALTGLRPAVVSLIASAGLSIILTSFFGENIQSWLKINISNIDLIACGIFTASLIVLFKFKLNPIYVILGSGAAGALLYMLLI
jgi:chromate transporter